ALLTRERLADQCQFPEQPVVLHSLDHRPTFLQRTLENHIVGATANATPTRASPSRDERPPPWPRAINAARPTRPRARGAALALSSRSVRVGEPSRESRVRDIRRRRGGGVRPGTRLIHRALPDPDRP